jgi:putative transcriptional regulator
MHDKKKLYHYVECGLTNIYLQNGFKLDREKNLFIEDINNLHKIIGLSIVKKRMKLNGREIRFIRHMMDLSQRALGQLIGVGHQNILRWESGKFKITQSAERVLRIIFFEFLDEKSRAKDLIDELSDLDNQRDNEKIKLFRTRNDWKQAV